MKFCIFSLLFKNNFKTRFSFSLLESDTRLGSKVYLFSSVGYCLYETDAGSDNVTLKSVLVINNKSRKNFL